MKRNVLCICLALTTPLFADAPAKDVRWQLAAARKYLQESDRKLNAVYKDLIRRCDDELEAAVRDAQRAWLKYRDAYAETIANSEGKSPDRIELLRTVALADLTACRCGDIQRIMAEAGDPVPDKIAVKTSRETVKEALQRLKEAELDPDASYIEPHRESEWEQFRDLAVVISSMLTTSFSERLAQEWRLFERRDPPCLEPPEGSVARVGEAIRVTPGTYDITEEGDDVEAVRASTEDFSQAQMSYWMRIPGVGDRIQLGDTWVDFRRDGDEIREEWHEFEKAEPFWVIPGKMLWIATADYEISGSGHFLDRHDVILRLEEGKAIELLRNRYGAQLKDTVYYWAERQDLYSWDNRNKTVIVRAENRCHDERGDCGPGSRSGPTDERFVKTANARVRSYQIKGDSLVLVKSEYFVIMEDKEVEVEALARFLLVCLYDMKYRTEASVPKEEAANMVNKLESMNPKHAKSGKWTGTIRIPERKWFGGDHEDDYHHGNTP